jgi:hypothetical protein
MKKIGLPALGLLCALAACRERGRPDPNIRMAPSHDVDPQAAQSAQGEGQGQGQAGAQAVPNRLEVPVEVEQAYSGVRLAWKDSTSGKDGLLDVPLGGTAKVPGSDLEVRGDVYLPAFSMSGGAITSSGIEEANPAARITVAEKGQEIFGGWIFTRFPDVHPFQHPRYTLRLVGGIRRAPAPAKKA